MNTAESDSDALVVRDTQNWLRRAVIGLNLCPFAKAVDVKGQVHYAVSHAIGMHDFLDDLKRELRELAATDAALRDTTLLIAAEGFAEFLDFNALIAQADRLLLKMDLQGVFQIASLHPQYQFADTAPDDITNCTNRSPYPTLHLLREESIDRAVQAFPHAEAIFEANMRTMERLGRAGWEALGVQASVRGKIDP
ncbi:MAG: DUF1415 domain-containing protein [Rhodoferax sp.]